MPSLSVLGSAKPAAALKLSQMMQISLEQANVILVDVYGFYE